MGAMMSAMTVTDPKTNLRSYLQNSRDALVWKLEGLSEYDIRRPVVRTGTNLLGLIKHQAGVELGYFGATFGRPAPDGLSWDDTSTDFDLFAQPDESTGHIVDRYRRAWAHADQTISELPLDTVGRVPWWPAETNDVTLHHVLVHVTTETARHAGHADILRELIDGAAGLTPDVPNLPTRDQAGWEDHRAHVEHAARAASGRQDQ
jgi:uncharacterized damage-inducible protein DinB